MRFDKADHHVHTLTLDAVGFLKHFVGLADAGREAKVELEPPALLTLDQVEEMLRG